MPCVSDGDPETLDLGYSLQWLKTFPRTHEPESTTKNFFSNPSDWPGVYWLDEPEGGPLPVAGINVGGTGHWYDSYGGRCSGRQAPFGFWCSWSNPRSQLPSDPQTPYGLPGGFTFEDSSLYEQPARIGRWRNASGAVYHIASGFLSIQCLVESVENKTVHFDHGVGCDQAGPQPPTEGWYVDNVFEECDAPGEYYFSAEEKALYYTFNATEGPTGLESFALTTTKVIFNVSGTQAVPVVNVTIRGLTIRDAALTYLGTTEADIHYNPSDSDWVIQRSVSNAGGTIDFATDRLVPSVLHGPCTGSILATCIVLRNCLPA